jgi:lipopolysaccharide transport system ATP-binding protein
MTPAITVENLSKCYQLYNQPHDRLKQFLWRGKRQYFREFWALRNVSFQVGKGEVLGIIGQNGAGKSTLLQLLCGTLTPTSGSVKVNGRVAALLELGAGFNPEFSGRENVFMSAAILGLSQKEIEARYEEIVDFSGIRDFIDQPVKTYSSGMFVRLAFSVATSVDPDILVIDEALSVGDGAFARKSFDRIRSLKEAGKTILFCSHSLYQVEAFCDRVLWLSSGCIKQLGEPQIVVQKYNCSISGDSETTLSTLTIDTEESIPSKSIPILQGHARFSHVGISLDGKTGRVLNGRPNENNLTIHLQFVSDPKLPAPTIGVTIDYGNLVAVTSVVSLSDGVEIQRNEYGWGEVIINFPTIALRKGEYYVSAYLATEDAVHIYDSAQRAATLHIDDSFYEPGITILPHHWQSSANLKHTPTTTQPNSNEQLVKLFTGLPFWIDTKDSLGIAAAGIFEPVETLLLQSLIKTGDRVLDIGANIGYYTVLFASWVGPTGVVHAFEPDPDNFALLNINTLDFQKNGNVHLHAVALGETSGTANLFRSKDNIGMHRLYDSVCCDGSSVEVPVYLGDKFALDPIDLIKIDIEGFELFALNGLKNTVTNSPNLKILTEFSPLSMMEAGIQPLKWLEWIATNNFKVLAHNGMDWLPVSNDELKQELTHLTKLDLINLTSKLIASDNVTITDAAKQAALAVGYTRPILENLLLTKS